MIRLNWTPLSSVDDALKMLQTAIGVELGTLPPYLYAMFSIRPGKNDAAAARIRSIAMQEMVHLSLVCNILNALDGDPVLTPPTYPGPLPGDIGPPGGKPLTIHLLRFSKEAMEQSMAMERPEEPLDFPVAKLLTAAPPATVTIGQFYEGLDLFLKTLPPSSWKSDHPQIEDSQFFAGELFKIKSYDDAHRAIRKITSEGEGTKKDPLDFQHEVAHYYRFGECYHDRVLTKADNPLGYQWGPASLDLDWTAVYPAITDPGNYDFSKESKAVRDAQTACDTAYSRMVDALQNAVSAKNETPGQLGMAVRAMFDLRMAAGVALTTPLSNPSLVAGPSFVYKSQTRGAQ